MFITFKSQKEYEQTKSEINQIIGFLKGDNILDGFCAIKEMARQLNNSENLAFDKIAINTKAN